MTRTRAPRRAFALAAVLFLLAAIAPAYAAEDLVPVPAVTDQPIEAARSALLGAGFVVAEADVAGEPEGTVQSQAPAAETALPRGSIVLVEVRQRTESTQAPRAVGLSVAEAMAAFGSLYVLELTPVPGPAAEQGRIVEQTPVMGAPLPLRGVLRVKFVPQSGAEDRVPVPDASGLSSADGVKALAEAGLHARLARVVSSGAPPDLAIGQLPLPGTEVARFSSVVLVVTAPSEGEAPPAPTIDVPNLHGMSESSARAELDGLGLTPIVEWVEGPPSQAFLVAAQDPVPGTAVPAGSEVRMEIVRYAPPTGPSPRISVPSLVGMTQSQADDVLFSIGLVGAPMLAPHASVPALRVFAQDVPPGRLVDPGTVIGFRIATPPPPPPGPVPVPNFFGQTKGGALTLAAEAGLSLSFLEVVTGAHPPWRVYSQNVPAWTLRPLGSTVVVKYARPPLLPPMAPVPDLDGKTPGQAQALLSAAGFSGSRTDVTTIAHPPLRVFWQNPGPGTMRPVGSVVSYKVAKLPFNVKKVPDLLGKTKAAAVAGVTALGFVADPDDVVAPGKPLGKVFAQDPHEGTWRPLGSVVKFRVAAPLLVVVPNVVNLPTLAAKNALQAAGLGSTLVFQASPGKPIGIVWDQIPNVGASVAPGTNVTIRVQPGIGPVLGVVPGVLGKLKGPAAAEITAAGFVAN
ncbi:MAG TPA: PASTA domain-containing protein, partial [Planctomycetota bacterium]|nr:PASTA domain-containing protein [Planctomycetota bacterium]